MSNIPDITSLSDLLTTSPNQPSNSNISSNNPLQSGLASQILLPDQSKLEESESDKTTTYVRQDIDYNEVINLKNKDISYDDTDNDQGNGLMNKTKDGSPNGQTNEVEKLLSQQSIKLQLANERNDLLRKRTSLKKGIDDLRAKVKQLQELQARELARSKLSQLLDSNNNEYIREKNSSKNSLLDKDDDDYIVKNLHVLPSTDWIERLQLIKRFQPYLEIDEVKTSNFYNDKNELFRTIEYLVLSPLLFKLSIKLTINAKNESISSIILSNDKFLTTLTILSPSFAKILVSNYILQNKIDLVMYGLNSLAILVHKKVAIIYKAIRKFPQYVDQEKYSELIQKEEITNSIKLFAILKSIDNLTLSIAKDSKLYIISLHWDIVLSNIATGECESKLKLFVSNGDKDLPEANSLFLKLVNRYGILNSLCIILKEILDI